MTTEALWQELEAEIAHSAGGTWLTRMARPDPGQQFFVAVECSSRCRCLLLPLAKALLPARSAWPSCTGLELFVISMNDQAHLGVRLKDRSCSGVFSALAEDIADRIAATTDPRQAAAVLLERLRRWQQFLTASRDGLGLEAQRGLWAELHFLEHLSSDVGSQAAVESWKGPTAGHQDFQFGAGAIEVKATISKQPQAVRITSERQLDDTAGKVFLHVVILDEREDSAATEVGRSLHEMIVTLRSRFADDPLALSTFNMRLMDAGWIDANADRYDDRRWLVRSEHTFSVGTGFPRIVENMLPSGLGNVSYEISLAACAGFEITRSSAITAIQPPAS